MRNHVTAGIIKCLFEARVADLEKVDRMVKKVDLVFKISYLGFLEFMIEKKQLFKIGMVSHLCYKVSSAKHFAKQFYFL